MFTSYPFYLIVSFSNPGSDPCTPVLLLQHLTQHIAYHRGKINICRMNEYLNELITRDCQGSFSNHFMRCQSIRIFRTSGWLASNSKTYVRLTEFPYTSSGCFAMGKTAQLFDPHYGSGMGGRIFVLDGIKGPM